ncbi:MAG: histidine kinase [Bryobacteraceae bacterium]|nr:histidine kinase [Bryobacteraceae bacterium]
MVDLEHEIDVDAIGLIPAQHTVGGVNMVGYGFPARFQIDVAKDVEFRTGEAVVSESESDFPNPGPYPFVVRFAPRKARFVRLRANRLWQRSEEIWILALAEIMVFSGRRNVAFGRHITSNRPAPLTGTWTLTAALDYRTPLGLPQGVEESPSNGYHSAISTVENAEKWVVLDIGSVMPIDEIRLIPAHPTDWPDASGFGFPTRFTVAIDSRDDFASPELLLDTSNTDFSNPGDNVVAIDGKAKSGRFVRVQANRLHCGKGRCVFALAEIEVLSGSANVARGAKVKALDSFNFPARPRWDPSYLVDGFASERRLMPVLDWLEALATRSSLAKVREDVLNQRSLETELFAARLIGIASLLIGCSAAGAVLIMLRGRFVRQRQVQALREQIARDLHDEVGSSLASITVAASVAESSRTGEPQAADDFAEIRRIAQETTESLREIVWLLHSNRGRTEDLVDQMRGAAQRILRGVDYQFEIRNDLGSKTLALEVRRAAMLAFKESLNNVVKHASSRSVRVVVESGRDRFLFRVEDNGVGFRPTQSPGGEGLRNMRDRAKSLNGYCQVDSKPGSGTSVHFEVPIRA